MPGQAPSFVRISLLARLAPGFKRFALASAPTEKTLEDQVFPKRQRVAPRGKPSRVHAKAVAGWSAQNGRNGDSLPEKYCGYFSFEAAMDSAARGCEESVTYLAVPSRMIASASLERCTEIEGLVIKFRTQRASGDPPKQSAPPTQTPSTGRACGRASGPTVVIQ